MQNVETDPMTDYVGLAEGEYTVLLPGNQARARRDSKLNHCNNVQEYRGPVYRIDVFKFGHEGAKESTFCRSMEECVPIADKWAVGRQKYLDDLIKEAEYQEEKAGWREQSGRSVLRINERLDIAKSCREKHCRETETPTWYHLIEEVRV
jgi:hypothetical protein